MSSTRRKRVQVGWYCDHEDSAGRRDGTHMSSHGKTIRGKWHETFPEPNVYKAITTTDYFDPKKPPACPKSVPVYIYVDPS